MKNKKIIKALMMLCVITIITGCGKKDNTDTVQTEVPQTIEDEPEETVDEVSEEELASDTEKVDNTFVQPSAMDSLKAYNAFLNCEIGFYSDNDWYCTEDGCPSEYFADMTEEGPITLSDLMGQVTRSASRMFEASASVDRIAYSYVDCGNDGVPELALFLDGVRLPFMEEMHIFIFKLMPDEKLRVVFWDTYGYRSYGILNEYGCYEYGGSTGAASSVYALDYVDEQGVRSHIYTDYVEYGPYSLYIPGNGDFLENVTEDLDNIFIEYVSDKDCGADEEYLDYLKRCKWTYYESSGSYYDDYDNITRLNDAAIYEQGHPYREFWDATGLPLMTAEDMQNYIDELETAVGVTSEIKNGARVEWQELNSKQMELANSWKYTSTSTYMPENPSWEYYLDDSVDESIIHNDLKLTKISEEMNDITDDYAWFMMLGVEEPSWDQFSDDRYEYKCYGGSTYYPYMMDIIDKSTYEILYTLDMSEYMTPDNYIIGDAAFVDETIQYATSVGDVLYICTTHNTYAESAPHNAYITALDMSDDFKVIWKSEPLTCNAKNFVAYDDYIICGYGFTDEPDFVYVLDRYTGKRIATYPVATGPDYFYVIDGAFL